MTRAIECQGKLPNGRHRCRRAGSNGESYELLRIQTRAIRRCGELLNEIDPQQGGDRRANGRRPAR